MSIDLILQNIYGYKLWIHRVVCHVCCDPLILYAFCQKTATKAVIELKPGQDIQEGFQILIGLAEIHVPRMWVERHPDQPDHEVLSKGRGSGGTERVCLLCFCVCLHMCVFVSENIYLAVYELLFTITFMEYESMNTSVDEYASLYKVFVFPTLIIWPWQI